MSPASGVIAAQRDKLVNALGRIVSDVSSHDTLLPFLSIEQWEQVEHQGAAAAMEARESALRSPERV